MNRIFAVARKTWLEAFHNRAALVVILVFLGLLPALPFLLKGDGTQKGLVQMTITYTFLLANFLICVLTCLLAAATMCGEIERKEVHITDVKPLRRWEFLLGKWLGVVSLDAVLLLAVGLATYGVIQYVSRPVPGREKEHAELRREVLVSRRALTPPPLVSPERIREVAEQRYAEMEKQDRLPEGKTRAQILADMERQFTKHARSLPPRLQARWTVTGLKPGGEKVYIRYRHDSSRRQDPGRPKDRIRGGWFIGGGKAKRYRYGADATVGTSHEIAVNADAVAPDGSLRIEYVHFSPMLAIFPEDGIQVLQRAGPFVMNYLAAYFVILCEAAFLAAVGVAAGTFLSLPVASLVLFAVLVLGLMGHSIAGMIGTVVLIEPPTAPPEGDWIDQFFQWVWSVVAAVCNGLFEGLLTVAVTACPRFAAYYPVDYLSTGRMIPTGLLLRAALFLALLRGGLVGLAGCVIYRFRELARVTA
jgi:ABC-type transport system involved in multi-copper enzyme maturation permease subunit